MNLRKRIVSIATLVGMIVTSCNIVPLAHESEFSGEKPLKLWYDEPAPIGNETVIHDGQTGNNPNDGWEKWALPIGNGYMGAMVFGRTETERIQIADKTLANPYRSDNKVYGTTNSRGGLNNFAEIYLDFNHKDYTNFERELDLRSAVASVNYTADDVEYHREYFTSYPDNVLAINLTASENGKISFTLHPEIPFIKDYGATPGDGQGKTGTITAEGDTITMSGNMQYYDIDFEAQIKVIPTGGDLSASEDEKGNGTLVLENADEALVLVTLGTNYELGSSVFTEANAKKKLEGNAHPREKVTALMEAAVSKGYEELKKNHLEDYKTYFDRVELDLGGEFSNSKTTDELVNEYKKGNYDRYLEELFYQYGRYLLIASSRKGALPAHLQGAWNRYDSSPWTAGFWHNINVQMNYWPAFNSNLAEMFEPYVDYNKAYMELAEKGATAYVEKYFPEKLDKDGGNGWGIGTGGYAYTVEAPPTTGHSGPGTSALTSLMFWDYYDFTRNEKILEDTAYPVVSGVSRFLSKAVEKFDDLYLIKYSASPEQLKGGTAYRTVGTSFDQQMTYDNHKATLESAKILGIDESEDSLIGTIEEQIAHLDPVPIGKSGQIKEYREENYYGEIGEKNHRHVSQLKSLYPGTSINSTTPAWLDAAKVTLKNRGDGSTGWSIAHRLCLWARTKEGDKSYSILQNLLKTRILTNLWDSHPPFQIDGNFGGLAGMTEMLIQSHEGYIDFLPALPSAWSSGSYKGLVGRGNFEAGAEWQNGKADKLTITSRAGGECSAKYYNIALATVKDSKGNEVEFTSNGTDIITFDSVKDETYTITDIPDYSIAGAPSNLSVSYDENNNVNVTWSGNSGADKYNIYKAVESSPSYILLGTSDEEQFSCAGEDVDKQTTYKVVSVDGDGREGSGVTKLVNGKVVVEYEGEKIFGEDYAVQKFSKEQLKEKGWFSAETDKYASDSNGTYTAESGQLIMTKNSDTSTPLGAKDGDIVYAPARMFEKKVENWGDDSRVTYRTNHFKGKYSLDMSVSFPSGGGNVWLDVMGNTVSGDSDKILGRLKITGASKNLYVYNNKLNASTTDLQMWSNADRASLIKMVFDSDTSTYQIFKDGSKTPSKTTSAVSDGKSNDTFSMTGWGEQSPGAFISYLKVGAQKNTPKGAFAKFDIIQLSEIERTAVPSVDKTAEELKITVLTDTPSAVTSSLKELPKEMNGADITWTSGNSEIISDSGELVKTPDFDTDVTMTAKIVNPSDKFTVYLDFKLTVSGAGDMITVSDVTTDKTSVSAVVTDNANIGEVDIIGVLYNKNDKTPEEVKKEDIVFDEKTKNVKLEFTKNPTDYEVKIYVWNSLENMKALSKVYTY